MRRILSFAALIAVAACRTAPPAPPAPAAAAPLPPLDEAALDRSADACQDFYRFACGGWIARTEIPADRSAWSRGFAELDERNTAQLRRILEAAAAGRADPADAFSGKVGDYFGSCMDERGIEARGLADLKAGWARIDAIADRPALAAELARLHGAGMTAPFGLLADQDAKDATQVILIVNQGGLSLPDREYYLSDAGKNPEIRRAWAAHLRKMLGLAGLPPAQAEAGAAAVEQLETALARTHWTRAELRDPSRIYNRVDRAGLERLAPDFPWARFFAELGQPGLDAVSVTTPAFVAEVGKQFASAPLDAWKAYLRWRLLDDMAAFRAVPAALVQERFAFQSASFSGAKELQPRWKHCVGVTDEALGFALGQAYVRRHFGAEGKDRTTRLVAEIEKAMEADLGSLSWMDAPTRERAREKLARVVNKVGYPDAWRDYSTMRVDRGSFFANVLAAGRFETNRQLAKIGKPVDRGEWLMSPPAVNAYYNASMNEMVFPAGILQPPFFNREAPETVNYGAIGMVLGHELTHGFDDEGRQYDALGNLRDWWTPAVGAEFDRRAACLEKQYGAYEALPGVRLDGKLTLGENIADLGGLKLAFAAMQAARRAQPAGDRALLGFTPEQQFFVGYAQSWCSKYREQEARRRAVVDPHSPPRFRVNGPLSNLPEFARAFACAEGTPMARPAAERCEIW
ncbi:Endothelin-converting enzyme 1 [Anaeromyxobacter dehalogenans 2CP-1]|uniref:Endothelin-converting enzyme 1 n=1 Tax=Anaeromyxobacter dehalogenans (strain ATCC BAA-258 / DSM 21875 / 2CP-1) TaxID=455488 RepID=B8JGE3_ANAD2|nr:M13 family metallopeptidase [Anaeromyxobacter dehalogenans]ACL64614.1 Endothelin-converting enzyme 1 [Anaeromyxobacter dehalogenans 2CP-1]